MLSDSKSDAVMVKSIYEININYNIKNLTVIFYRKIYSVIVKRRELFLKCIFININKYRQNLLFIIYIIETMIVKVR